MLAVAPAGAGPSSAQRGTLDAEPPRSTCRTAPTSRARSRTCACATARRVVFAPLGPGADPTPGCARAPGSTAWSASSAPATATARRSTRPPTAARERVRVYAGETSAGARRHPARAAAARCGWPSRTAFPVGPRASGRRARYVRGRAVSSFAADRHPRPPARLRPAPPLRDRERRQGDAAGRAAAPARQPPAERLRPRRARADDRGLRQRRRRRRLRLGRRRRAARRRASGRGCAT